MTNKEIIFDYNNFIIRVIEYSGPGPDGIWFYGNDAIAEYKDIYFHSNYHMYNLKEYNGSGPNGIWFTDDDLLFEEDEFGTQRLQLLF